MSRLSSSQGGVWLASLVAPSSARGGKGRIYLCRRGAHEFGRGWIDNELDFVWIISERPSFFSLRNCRSRRRTLIFLIFFFCLHVDVDVTASCNGLALEEAALAAWCYLPIPIL